MNFYNQPPLDITTIEEKARKWAEEVRKSKSIEDADNEAKDGTYNKISINPRIFANTNIVQPILNPPQPMLSNLNPAIQRKRIATATGFMHSDVTGTKKMRNSGSDSVKSSLGDCRGAGSSRMGKSLGGDGKSQSNTMKSKIGSKRTSRWDNPSSVDRPRSKEEEEKLESSACWKYDPSIGKWVHDKDNSKFSSRNNDQPSKDRNLLNPSHNIYPGQMQVAQSVLMPSSVSHILTSNPIPGPSSVQLPILNQMTPTIVSGVPPIDNSVNVLHKNSLYAVANKKSPQFVYLEGSKSQNNVPPRPYQKYISPDVFKNPPKPRNLSPLSFASMTPPEDVFDENEEGEAEMDWHSLSGDEQPPVGWKDPEWDEEESPKKLANKIVAKVKPQLPGLVSRGARNERSQRKPDLEKTDNLASTSGIIQPENAQQSSIVQFNDNLNFNPFESNPDTLVAWGGIPPPTHAIPLWQGVPNPEGPTEGRISSASLDWREVTEMQKVPQRQSEELKKYYEKWKETPTLPGSSSSNTRQTSSYSKGPSKWEASPPRNSSQSQRIRERQIPHHREEWGDCPPTMQGMPRSRSQIHGSRRNQESREESPSHIISKSDVKVRPEEYSEWTGSSSMDREARSAYRRMWREDSPQTGRSRREFDATCEWREGGHSSQDFPPRKRAQHHRLRDDLAQVTQEMSHGSGEGREYSPEEQFPRTIYDGPVRISSLQEYDGSRKESGSGNFRRPDHEFPAGEAYYQEVDPSIRGRSELRLRRKRDELWEDLHQDSVASHNISESSYRGPSPQRGRFWDDQGRQDIYSDNHEDENMHYLTRGNPELRNPDYYGHSKFRPGFDETEREENRDEYARLGQRAQREPDIDDHFENKFLPRINEPGPVVLNPSFRVYDPNDDFPGARDTRNLRAMQGMKKNKKKFPCKVKGERGGRGR